MFFLGSGLLYAEEAGPPPVTDAYATSLLAITGLVAYWRMDAPGAIGDASGNGRTGTFTGTPTLIGSMTAPWQQSDNKALDFGGTSSGTVAHNAVYQLASGTLAFYFRPTAGAIAAAAGILGKDSAGLTNDEMAVRLFADGSMRCYFQTGGVATDLNTHTGVIEAGVGYHVMVAWDPLAVWLLLDGRQVAWSRRHTTGLTTNAQPWRFGIRTFDDVLADVAIDEVALWNRRLSWDELDIVSELARGLAYDDKPATRAANSVATIQNQMALSGPGDIIEVAAGTYTGVTATLTNSGAKWNPWVIRPQAGATVTFVDHNIILENRWCVFDGIRMESGRFQPGVNARYWRLTRARGRNLDTHFCYDTGMFGRADHCDLANITKVDGVAGFRAEIDVATPKQGAYALYDHHYLHDTVDAGGNGHELIQLGANQDDSQVWPCCTVEYVLFDNTKADGEVCSIKSNGHLFRAVTVQNLGATGGNVFGCRHGGEVWFEQMYMKDIGAIAGSNSGFRILNRDCVVITARVDNCRGAVFAGDQDADDWMNNGPTGTYPAGKRTMLISCTTSNGGTWVSGHDRGGMTVQVTGTEAYDSSAITEGPLGAGDTVQSAAEPIPYPALIQLTAAQVGLAAADPLAPPGYL